MRNTTWDSIPQNYCYSRRTANTHEENDNRVAQPLYTSHVRPIPSKHRDSYADNCDTHDLISAQVAYQAGNGGHARKLHSSG